MIGVDINVTGAKELDAALLRLGKVGERVLKKAVTKGANVILKEARKNAKTKIGGEMGGLIAKYLISRVWKRKHAHLWARNIRVSKDGNEQFVHQAKNSKYKSGRTYIPTAIEYGHTFPNGTFVPPNSFMRAAFDSKKGDARRVTISEIKQGVKRDFNKR